MECIKCRTEMITAKFNADMHGLGVYLSNKKKGIFEPEERSSVTCYVCPECGYIELNADSPKNLILK